MIIRAKSSARYQYQSFSLFLCIHGRRAASEGIAGEAADVGQVQSLEDEQLQAYMQDDQPMLTAVQAAATTYQVGEKKYIYRTNGHDTYGKTYICIGVGEHC